MHPIKKIFTNATGYWLHKISTLPIGADLHVDIHHRIKYAPLEVIFDVGANHGQTWELFRTIESNAKIYSFEPVAGSFKILKETVATDPNTVLESIALGDVPGEKIIRLFDDMSALNSLKDELMNNEANAKTEKITIDTLDNYCKKKSITKIDFLKIDTEGYEINVLEGANQMLNSASISFIYCEVGILKRNTRNTNFSDLTEWLAKKDYLFFGLYQLVGEGWSQGNYFGNALYVHKDIYKI